MAFLLPFSASPLPDEMVGKFWRHSWRVEEDEERVDAQFIAASHFSFETSASTYSANSTLYLISSTYYFDTFKCKKLVQA